MVGILRRIEQGTTTVRDARAAAAWAVALMAAAWVLGFVAGRVQR